MIRFKRLAPVLALLGVATLFTTSGAYGLPFSRVVAVGDGTTRSETYDLTQAEPALFDIEYDASTGLRPDEVCPAWDMSVAGLPAPAAVNSGFLTIATTQDAEIIWFERGLSEANIPDTLVIETRMQYVSGSSSLDYRTAAGILFTTSPELGNTFWIGDDVIFLAGNDTERGQQAAVDTNDFFHTYRIEVTGTDIQVFYDGLLTLTGTSFSSPDSHGPDPRVVFGEASSFAFGVSRWEFVRHNAGTAPCADLEVEVTDDKDPVIATDLLTYEIKVTNHGPETAANVLLIDELPSEPPSVDVWVHPGFGECSYAAGTVTCRFADLPPSAARYVTVFYHVPIDVADGAVLANTARVTADVEDPNPGNNSATEETTVVNQPVTVSPVAPQEVLAGSRFDVTIQVDDVVGLLGAQANVQFDPFLLTLLDVQLRPEFGTGLDEGVQGSSLPSCYGLDNLRNPGDLILVLLCVEGPLTGAPLPLWTLGFEAATVGSDVSTDIVVEDVVIGGAGEPLPQPIPAFGDSTTVIITTPLGICGDQNEDAKVNILDAIIDMQIITGWVQPSPTQLILSDLDRDGRITVVDLILLLQITVGKIDVTKCGPPT